MRSNTWKDQTLDIQTATLPRCFRVWSLSGKHHKHNNNSLKKKKQRHFGIYHLSSQERTTKNTPPFLTLGEKNLINLCFKKSTRTSPWQIPKSPKKVLQRLDASGHHLHPQVVGTAGPTPKGLESKLGICARGGIYLWFFVWYMEARPNFH